MDFLIFGVVVVVVVCELCVVFARSSRDRAKKF